MKKISIIILGLFFLTSCTDGIYFKNCVKDAMKVYGVNENTGASYCQNSKRMYPDKFKYLKGRMYSSGKSKL